MWKKESEKQREIEKGGRERERKKKEEEELNEWRPMEKVMCNFIQLKTQNVPEQFIKKL